MLNPNKNMLRYNLKISLDEFVRKKEENINNITNLWKKEQNLLQSFWKSWKTDYLIQLRCRKEIFHKQKNSKDKIPHIGDVVHVADITKYNEWKLCKILELHLNQKQKPISATVKCGDKILHKSLKHLSLLECSASGV